METLLTLLLFAAIVVVASVSAWALCRELGVAEAGRPWSPAPLPAPGARVTELDRRPPGTAGRLHDEPSSWAAALGIAEDLDRTDVDPLPFGRMVGQPPEALRLAALDREWFGDGRPALSPGAVALQLKHGRP